MSRALVFAAAALGALATGCEDLSRFSTGADEAYCGAVVLGSEFRQGLSPRVEMSLTLDATKLDGPVSPGALSTFEPAGDGVPETRMLDDAALRLIVPMEHDPLSRLTFGDGRDRSAIYAVSPADEKDASLLAVLSLMHDDSVQVRLLRPGRSGAATGDSSIFGLFPLLRRPGGCGF